MSLLLIIACFILGLNSSAQQTDTLKGRNIYNPERLRPADTLHPPGVTPEQAKRMQDSIAVRSKFLLDSLLAREQFIRDSLQRRQRILDSLVFLQGELQSLLEAYIRATQEEIVFRCRKITLSGDTALNDFVYLILPFGVTDPYTPWKKLMSLNGKSVKVATDKKNRIVSVHTPQMKASFAYADEGNVMIVQEPATLQNNWAGSFYKIPVDSVFFDRLKRVIKIKKYVHFYSLINGNQKGNLLFTNRTQVKQYVYAAENRLMQFQLVKFCERWKAYEPNKICSIITYEFSEQGSTLQLTRRNDPANQYSDGTYTFAFDAGDNLRGISFRNLANTENWQRMIELNSEGNVSCYIDKTGEIIRQSLCMVYHDNDPQAKVKVETITTTFEKDGISYYQKNNTTGKIRTRDRLTLEWSPWH